jgi:hypothetical protein
VSDPNQDRRLARVGLLGSRAGLGPLAQTTEAWIYQVFFCPENKAVFFCFVLPIMMVLFQIIFEKYWYFTNGVLVESNVASN